MSALTDRPRKSGIAGDVVVVIIIIIYRNSLQMSLHALDGHFTEIIQ